MKAATESGDDKDSKSNSEHGDPASAPWAELRMIHEGKGRAETTPHRRRDKKHSIAPPTMPRRALWMTKRIHAAAQIGCAPGAAQETIDGEMSKGKRTCPRDAQSSISPATATAAAASPDGSRASATEGPWRACGWGKRRPRPRGAPSCT